MLLYNVLELKQQPYIRSLSIEANLCKLTYTLHGAIDGESLRTAGETPPSV